MWNAVPSRDPCVRHSFGKFVFVFLFFFFCSAPFQNDKKSSYDDLILLAAAVAVDEYGITGQIDLHTIAAIDLYSTQCVRACVCV